MVANQKKYLNFLNYQELFSWDVKSYLNNSNDFNESYPLVYFGDFLKKPEIKKVKIEDENTYKILGVRSYGKGAFANRIVRGNTLKMREYQQAKLNHLFWCKVDTKNGAFGIINEDLADGIASSNMTFAEIDTSKINVVFLQLLFTSKGIMQYLDSFVTGTTNRKYIRPEQLFNDIKIPLPSLQEQERIVTAYQTKIQEAETLEKEANDLEGEIERYLFEELGINFQSKIVKSSVLQFVRFKDSSRWDTMFLLGELNNVFSKYESVHFADVIECFNKDKTQKSLRIESSKFPNQEFRYIGMEHIEKGTGILLQQPIVKGNQIKSQSIRVPSGFILFGKLRPYLNKYWNNSTSFDNIICSSEFFVFDINSKVNKDYFMIVLSSKIIQEQIADKTSGARMPRINEEIFYNLKFPLPPLQEQEKIVSKIVEIKGQIQQFNSISKDLIDDSIKNFEQEIFGFN